MYSLLYSYSFSTFANTKNENLAQFAQPSLQVPNRSTQFALHPTPLSALDSFLLYTLMSITRYFINLQYSIIQICKHSCMVSNVLVTPEHIDDPQWIDYFVMCDNVSFHWAAQVHDWFQDPPHVSILYLPPYSSFSFVCAVLRIPLGCVSNCEKL